MVTVLAAGVAVGLTCAMWQRWQGGPLPRRSSRCSRYWRSSSAYRLSWQCADEDRADSRVLARARTRAALAAKQARGERVGGVPYGYRDEGGMLVEDAAEQVVVS